MSKKQQQKVGLCKKSSSTDAKAKEGKKRHLQRKEKQKQTKKKTTLGSFSQSPNLSAGFQQDQGTTLPSWYVAEQEVFYFYCTCGNKVLWPFILWHRERKREEQRGENKERGFSEAAANMLRVAGSWLSHRLTGTANSMRNRRGRGEKRGVCQSKPEISGLEVGWEICVLTIWNRHLHCDSTNPRKA